MDEDLYLLPMAGQFLLYSPLRQRVARIDADARDALLGAQAPLEVLEELRPWAEITPAPPVLPPLTPDGDVLPRTIVIFPTHHCNMRCVYCSFGSDACAGSPLNTATANAFISRVFSLLATHQRDDVHIHFFGGEPLLEERFMHSVVRSIRSLSQTHGVRAHLEVSTNGSISDTMAAFVARQLDTVVLSFDGTRALQNAYRPHADGTGSHENVMQSIERFSRGPCELCLRMCVTQESVDRLPAIADQLSRDVRPSTLDFEPLTPTPSSRAVGLAPPDPVSFARSFMEARTVAAGFGVEVVNGLTQLDRTTWSSCPFGLDTLMLMPDGRITTCYLPPAEWDALGLSSVLGGVEPDGTFSIRPERFDAIQNVLRTKSRCASCFCRWTCAGGCHAHHTPPGCPDDYTDVCIQTRLVTAASLLEATDADPHIALLNHPAAIDRLSRLPDDRLVRQSNGGTR